MSQPLIETLRPWWTGCPKPVLGLLM